MKSRKNILGKILIITVCLISFVLVASYIIPSVIVIFGMAPSLEHVINDKKGFYPSADELGDAVWGYKDSEINVELITIDGKIVGEITTAESTYTVRGNFLYAGMYLSCMHQNDFNEDSSLYSHTIIEAEYKYVDGKIACSDLKTDSNHLDYSKDFTLTKEKNIEKNSQEKWQCEEINIQLFSYPEIDEYYVVEFSEKNEKFQLMKRYENYYELTFSPCGYVVCFIMHNQDGKMSFEIVSTYIDESRTYEQYIPNEIKTLTFKKES